ncbi:MarR family transcriptional regulator [soil metagenome]
MTAPAAPPADDAGPNLLDGLVQLSFLVQGLLTRAGADEGLTPVQLRLLGVLRDREPTMGEIARHLDLDKSSVTGLVDRAEKRGLVRRTSSTEDGRSIHVVLTADGRRMVADGARALEHRVAEVAERLTPAEATQLATLAHRLVAPPAQ